jgi:hypothetical protein
MSKSWRRARSWNRSKGRRSGREDKEQITGRERYHSGRGTEGAKKE